MGRKRQNRDEMEVDVKVGHTSFRLPVRLCRSDWGSCQSLRISKSTADRAAIEVFSWYRPPTEWEGEGESGLVSTLLLFLFVLLPPLPQEVSME